MVGRAGLREAFGEIVLEAMVEFISFPLVWVLGVGKDAEENKGEDEQAGDRYFHALISRKGYI